MGKKFVRPDGIKVWRGSHDSTPRERLLDITMNNNAIQGDWKKSYSVSHLQRGSSIGSWKL